MATTTILVIITLRPPCSVGRAIQSMFVNLRLSNVLGVCPNNWSHMQGSCYKFSNKELNWTAAKSACETLGSKLVVINSPSEVDALGSEIPDTWPGNVDWFVLGF
ncbi:plasmacytoid dendritic cell antigen processing and presentation [Desmophyllum pertusum]|uniref:Plasmacytoid dendritic cell antigen processing and presentation n=1 Tax=Desmophyllum pertusum TaxID=174260 RepID=A0A9W9YR97_9CNID|nr:plasmacytoid dendritic cell antigen processing and presentation [Desmophyllum pertusum]